MRSFLPDRGVVVLAALLAAAVLLSSCGARRVHVRPDPTNPVYSVAVLPMYNFTNDVGGAETVREELAGRLDDMHYMVMPLEEVDRLLQDRMGITLGDQLELTDPPTVGEVLGTDGLVYGYLLDFDDINTGVYNVKKVRAGFRLVEAGTGRVVWARGLGVKSLIAGGDVGAGVTIFKELTGGELEVFETVGPLSEIPGLKDWYIARVFGTEKIEEAVVLSIGESLITRLFGVHLRLETNVMLNRLMRGFPPGPGRPGLAPELETAPAEVGGRGPVIRGHGGPQREPREAGAVVFSLNISP